MAGNGVRRRLVLTALALFIAASSAAVVTTARQPRYLALGETPAWGGPDSIWYEWRGDRWTGSEQSRAILFGHASGWRWSGWHPLRVWLSEGR